MDLGAPVGSKAAGDLAEDDRGSDFPLGDIVGRGHVAVGHEDEDLGAPGLDPALEIGSGGMGGGDADQGVEAALGFRA